MKNEVIFNAIGKADTNISENRTWQTKRNS